MRPLRDLVYYDFFEPSLLPVSSSRPIYTLIKIEYTHPIPRKSNRAKTVMKTDNRVDIDEISMYKNSLYYAKISQRSLSNTTTTHINIHLFYNLFSISLSFPILLTIHPIYFGYHSSTPTSMQYAAVRSKHHSVADPFPQGTKPNLQTTEDGTPG